MSGHLGGDPGSWLGSEVSVHHGVSVSIGLEDLPQVSELLPPCAATANLLSSVPQTLDDASFDFGQVVGVKVEVSVCHLPISSTPHHRSMACLRYTRKGSPSAQSWQP